MNIRTRYSLPFLAAEDLDGKEYTLTIRAHRDAKVYVPKKKKEIVQSVLFFEGAKKGLLLKTYHVNTLVSLFGKETDDWIGKRVTLYEERDFEAFGKVFNLIRIRDKTASGKPTAIPSRDEENGEAGDIGDDDNIFTVDDSHEEEHHESPDHRAGLLKSINDLLESQYIPEADVTTYRDSMQDLTDSDLEDLHDELNTRVNAALDAEASGA